MKKNFDVKKISGMVSLFVQKKANNNGIPPLFMLGNKLMAGRIKTFYEYNLEKHKMFAPIGTKQISSAISIHKILPEFFGNGHGNLFYMEVDGDNLVAELVEKPPELPYKIEITEDGNYAVSYSSASAEISATV